jgi:hypothetical protein
MREGDFADNDYNFEGKQEANSSVPMPMVEGCRAHAIKKARTPHPTTHSKIVLSKIAFNVENFVSI